MDDTPSAPRAVMVLVNRSKSRVLAPVERTTPCDLELVHRLLWLHLRARRMGWKLQLVDVDDDLRELLDLVGVTTTFGL